MSSSRFLASILLLVVACNDDGPPAPVDAVDAGIDGIDATPDQADAAPDAVPPDAAPDAAVGFPVDPQPGQFEWGVIVPGVGDGVVTTVLDDGSIVIAAKSHGAIDAGDVHVPAPAGKAVLLLALDPTGRPRWARSMPRGPEYDDLELAGVVELAGDVVIAGTFKGNAFDPGLGPLTSAGKDGFVARFDAASGATEWARSFGGTFGDRVPAVAVDPDHHDLYLYFDPAGYDAEGVELDAQLRRYDEDGNLEWQRELPLAVYHDQGLTVDASGPLVAGRYYRPRMLDGHALPHDEGDDDGTIGLVGLDRDGQVRFVRSIVDEEEAYRPRVTSGGGAVYFASENARGELFSGDQVLTTSSEQRAVAVKLDASGQPSWIRSFLLSASFQGGYVGDAVAVDSGALLLSGSCAGRTWGVCAGGNSFVGEIGPDGTPRWITSLELTWVTSMARVPARDRVIVFGDSDQSVRLGGVTLEGYGLVVASLATGMPQAQPEVPRITSVELEGVPDGQIRQGAAGVLVVHGEHLHGLRDLRLAEQQLLPDGFTSNELRIPFQVPHGHEPGPLILDLAGASLATSLTVTPIVLGPAGKDDARGTFTSPMRLCRQGGWYDVAGPRDTLFLQAGSHACDDTVFLRRGMHLVGEGVSQTFVRGTSSFSKFEGFWFSSGHAGTSEIRDFTIDGAKDEAIYGFEPVFDAHLSDIEFRGEIPRAIFMFRGLGRITLDRVVARNGVSSFLGLGGEGEVVARNLQVDVSTSVFSLDQGSLDVRDSNVRGKTVVRIGSEYQVPAEQNRVHVENSRLRGRENGLEVYGVDMTLVDSHVLGEGTQTLRGIHLIGRVTMQRGSISGWKYGIDSDYWQSDDGPFIALDLDDVNISAGESGIDVYGEQLDDSVRLRHCQVHGGKVGVALGGELDVVDLGTVASPGDNQLSSGTAGPALRVYRYDPPGPADAHGTTLNGHALTGEVAGPMSSPDLELGQGNLVRF